MQLYILRHGDAPFSHPDNERSLSELGKQQTKQVVLNRLDELSKVEHIICSPVLRARQTLDAVKSCLDTQHLRISFEDSLRSESSLSDLAQFMNNCPQQTTLLISHQPLVGKMVDFLQDSQGNGMLMGTSCLAAFDVLAFSQGGAELQWLDSP